MRAISRLTKSGLCSLYRGERTTFDRLRGVDHVRHLTAQLLRPDCPVPPKGWLFVGAPNCGKTTVAKAVINILGATVPGVRQEGQIIFHAPQGPINILGLPASGLKPLETTRDRPN